MRTRHMWSATASQHPERSGRITGSSPIKTLSAPFFAWLPSVALNQNIVLRSGNQRVLMEGMLAGIGFMRSFQTAGNPNLEKVMPRH